MAKSANLYARIEPDVKNEAEAILGELGIPASSAINMFYKQIILQGGLPFEVKLPKHPLSFETMTEQELSAELQKGFDDVDAGRVKSGETVFTELHKKYHI